ncbi:MAG: amidohydrolase family protein [Candidatus Acidiferrales bacterium]
MKRCAYRAIAPGYFISVLLLASCSAAETGTKAAKQPASASEITAFTNVNVVPMDTERVLRDQTVIVRDGRIAGITSAAQAQIPAGARIIPGNGLYLLPGLADMHVHIWYEQDLLLYVANGVTFVRNMNGRPYHLQWREQLRRGEILGPHLLTAGPTVYSDPPDARALVREQKAAGYDFIKVYHFISGAAHRAILAAAREAGMPVAGHKSRQIPLLGLMKTDQRSIEHLQGYVFYVESPDSPLRKVRQRGQWSHRYHYFGVPFDAEQIAVMARATRDAEFWNTPTIVSGDRWAPDSALRAVFDAPHARYLLPPLASRSGPGEDLVADWTPEVWRMGQRNRRELVRGLHQAGAKLMLGTDAGSWRVEPGFSVHTELLNLAEAGLTPYEALRTATANPAEFLAQSGEFGAVATGRRADLLLVEANPLEDLKNLQRRVGVMLAGRWFPQAHLQRLLESRVAPAHSQP